MCHLVLFGLPLLALSTFWLLPLAFALPTFVALIAATILFYTYLVKGARRPVMVGLEAMQHALGEVRSVQGSSATVWVNSELWSAQAKEELHVGDQVEVVGIDGLRLHVRTLPPGAKQLLNGIGHPAMPSCRRPIMKIRRSRFTVGLVLALGIGLGLVMLMWGHSPGIGPGGSGGYGMGMMGGFGPRNEVPSDGSVSSADWGKLASYVQSNGLACMSCHTLSGKGAGPAFIDIAHRFAGQPNGATEVSNAISNGIAGQWPGYPPMPSGLATPRQAKALTDLILHLAN